MCSHTQLRVSSVWSFLGRTHDFMWPITWLWNAFLCEHNKKRYIFGVRCKKALVYLMLFLTILCAQVDDDNVSRRAERKMQYKVQLKFAFGHPINIVNVARCQWCASLRRVPVLLRLYECVCRSVVCCA